MPKNHVKSKRSRSQAVGILMAAAVIPRSFQQSLMPRNTVDQGIVTGLTMAMVYMMGVLVQDGLNITGDSFVEESEQDKEASTTVPFLVSLAAIGAGYFLEKKFGYEKEEATTKSAVRTSGYWLKNAGIAGTFASLIEAANLALSEDEDKSKERDLLPYFAGAGILFTLVGEYLRVRQDEDYSVKTTITEAKPLRTVGMGVAVAGVLGGIAFVENKIAKTVDEVLDKSAPRLKKKWLPVGHVVGAGGMAFLLAKYLQRTYTKIEQNAEDFEQGFLNMPESSLVSGSIDSLVPWSSLTVQGRRHLLSCLTEEQIKDVMGTKSINPIRIFIGLDSADNEEERVQLALDELERTNAYDRETIVVVSPTGTGYVNYIFSESLEYMAKGNIASVTIQYSKRPSPMSLDRVEEGHMQYRMLLNGISRRISKMPKDKKPRIVLFGESLGAWTSQDALMHSGTDGLKALGIERALWIGTPKGSKWKSQIVSRKWLNTDHELVGIFDNYSEVLSRDKQEINSIRYFLVTHYNDPISQFGLELLVKQPEWVADEEKRPKSLSPSVRYRTPTLFVQMLIDMKNALKPIPGDFVASGHDYRGDLAKFSALAFGYKVTEKQFEDIEAALRSNEIHRSKLIEQGKATSNNNS